MDKHKADMYKHKAEAWRYYATEVIRSAPACTSEKEGPKKYAAYVKEVATALTEAEMAAGQSGPQSKP